MEEELYNQLDEDSRKKMIYKMASERDEESNDVKAATKIKDKNGMLVTDRKEVPYIWKEYFKTLLNQREKRELNRPSAVEGELTKEEIGFEEMHEEYEEM